MLSFVHNRDGTFVTLTPVFEVDLCALAHSPDHSNHVQSRILTKARNMLNFNKLERLCLYSTVILLTSLQHHPLIKSKAEVIVNAGEALVGHFHESV